MKFEFKTQKELAEMTEEQVTKYQADLETHRDEQMKSEVSTVVKSEIETATKTLEDFLGKEIANQLADKTTKSDEISEPVRKALADNDEAIKEFLTNKTGKLEIEVKGSQVPSDIADRDSYALMLPGTGRKPFRRFSILDLFRRTPVNKEFVKYREENVVTRDAKVVVACASSTHNTKKTWIERVVQITKIRDFVDVCVDMMDDYDFVASEIRQLVEQSLKSKEESEILLGTGTGAQDILSIETIASEFDPENVLAPFDGTTGTGFQEPTLAELTGAMKAQIYTFGQENAWDADTIAMNYNDMVRFMHQKNLENDYLLPNFVLTNGGILNGMRIVTSPLIAPNTLYVFDSTRGEILDRKQLTVELSYENATNFQTETVTVKAVERMQFHVSIINRDAFMKCSDITTALTAITNA